MDVKNKIVIVTGASSGIGEATARLLTQQAAKVALVARSKKRLEELSKELPDSFVVVCDVSKPDEVHLMVQKVHEHYGRIDILINNAGHGYDTSIENIELKKYRELFDLNSVGPLVGMQSVIPIMKKQGGGFILNVSSGTALMNIPNIGAYASLKRALVGLSLTAHAELEKDNIVVSVIYPYITKTDFYKHRSSNENSAQVKVGDNRMKDADTPEFVAEKILEGIKSEQTEIFVHDWMGKGKQIKPNGDYF